MTFRSVLQKRSVPEIEQGLVFPEIPIRENKTESEYGRIAAPEIVKLFKENLSRGKVRFPYSVCRFCYGAHDSDGTLSLFAGLCQEVVRLLKEERWDVLYEPTPEKAGRRRWRVDFEVIVKSPVLLHEGGTGVKLIPCPDNFILDWSSLSCRPRDVWKSKWKKSEKS